MLLEDWIDKAMTKQELYIDGHLLTINQIVEAGNSAAIQVVLDAEAEKACLASRKQVEMWLGDDAPVVYGVNTGLGNLKDTALSPSQHMEWNLTIPYPHAVGMGAFINPVITRTALLIRANVLSRSYSGVRPALIHRMLALFNAGVSPAIRELGSTGLSDLGPMSHCAMVLSGIDGARVFHNGKLQNTSECFPSIGLQNSFPLECKEVLSIMNGSTMTQAAAVLCVSAVEAVLNYQNQLENIIAGDFSEYADIASFNEAITATFVKIRKTVEFENNISCDNPLLFESGTSYDVVMGCNCSNTQVGYDIDLLCIVLADKASLLSELIKRALINTGYDETVFAIAGNALQNIYDNAQPASADSIPTKAGQEDHVEFSYGAVRKAFNALAYYRTLLSCLLIVLAKDSSCEIATRAVESFDVNILTDPDTSLEVKLAILGKYLDQQLGIVSFSA